MTRAIGRRVRQVRKSRDKALPVIAGPAGMSKSKTNDKWYITGHETEKC